MRRRHSPHFSPSSACPRRAGLIRAFAFSLVFFLASCSAIDRPSAESNSELDIAVAAADVRVRTFVDPNPAGQGIGDALQFDGCEIWPGSTPTGDSGLGFGDQSTLCLVEVVDAGESQVFLLGVAAVDEPSDAPFDNLLLEVNSRFVVRETAGVDVDGAEPITQTCWRAPDEEVDRGCAAIFIHDDLHVLLTHIGPDASGVSALLGELLPALLERVASLEQS